MGVPETLQRGVGIALVIGVGVVLGVSGGPVKGGTLHGHGTGDQEKGFQPRLGLKSLVGEHPVETQGDAKTADRVHHKKKAEVHPVHPLVPKKNNGADDPEDGEPNEGQEDKFGERSRCVGVGNGCAQVLSFAYIPKGGKRSPKIYLNCCIAKGVKGLRDPGVKKTTKELASARGVAHDGEEKKHFEDIDQDENAQKDVESGKGEVGQTTEESVRHKGNPEHAGGQEEAGFQPAVFGMEKGKGKG